jgi:hypothetical protein
MFDFPVFLNYERNYEYPISFNLGTQDYDPYRDNVIFHVPFENKGSSTYFYDTTGKPLSYSGSCSISTIKKPYGTGSANIGSTSYIRSSSTLLDLKNNFTIEAFVNITTLPSTGGSIPILAKYNSWSTISYWMDIYNTGTTYILAFTSSADGTNFVSVAGNITSQISTNKWFHVAVSKHSNTLYIFLNGKIVYRGLHNTNIYANSGTYTYIGALTINTWYANSHFKDVRITNGVARYIKPFDVPKSLLPTIKNPIPIVDPSFGVGVLNRYQGALFIDNYLRPAHIGRQSISRDTQPVLTVDRKIANITPYNKLDRMSLLPHNPWVWYRINENSYKINYPILYNRALPSGWSIYKNIGVYVGGNTDNQYWSIAINPTESVNTNWTFLCRLKPTTTAADYTPSCSGTSFLYTQNQMLVQAGHGGSTTSVGVGISLGTNWSFVSIHGDSLYTPVTKITASITTDTWVWIAVVVTSINTIKHLVFSETGALLGTASITCSSLTNVKSPHGLGSAFAHGQGYVSNTMTFMSALSNEQIVGVIKEPYKVLTPRAVT